MPSLYDDPRLYDLLFRAEPHATFYSALARRQKGSVLELACGTGQLLLPIAKLGFRSVGLDLHPSMLSTAKGRAQTVGADVSLIEGDMRSFFLDEKFSLVFIARNSLLHLHTRDDFAQVFGNVRKHLENDGLFAFDIFNPSVSILANDPEKKDLIDRLEYPGRGTLTVEATADYDERTQVNRSTWFVSSDVDADVLIAPLHLRSIFPEELLYMLDYFGFTLEARYGDFSSAEFRSSSRLQVCLCRA
jgi:SAM-dependent methyltransferase